MIKIFDNNVIEINRGDTADFPVYLDIGTRLEPQIYDMKEGDMLYFAIMEPHQRFEDALVRYAFSHEDFDAREKAVIIHLYAEDTEYLEPGVYYYQIKLVRAHDNTPTGYEAVDTLVDKTKFILLD